ncbi:unnamed protein product [Closterium sp. NIES-64]|nr:unnamed protein product [Closterium sp. NIES-64]
MQACRATSAAPSIFMPALVRSVDGRREMVCVDGGMVANNPTVAAFLHIVANPSTFKPPGENNENGAHNGASTSASNGASGSTSSAAKNAPSNNADTNDDGETGGGEIKASATAPVSALHASSSAPAADADWLSQATAAAGTSAGNSRGEISPAAAMAGAASADASCLLAGDVQEAADLSASPLLHDAEKGKGGVEREGERGEAAGSSESCEEPLSRARLTFRDVVVLSLGAGEHMRRYSIDEVKKWGLIGWAEPMVDVMVWGGGNMVHAQMCLLALADGAIDNYTRIEVSVGAFDAPHGGGNIVHAQMCLLALADGAIDNYTRIEMCLLSLADGTIDSYTRIEVNGVSIEQWSGKLIRGAPQGSMVHAGIARMSCQLAAPINMGGVPAAWRFPTLCSTLPSHVQSLPSISTRMDNASRRNIQLLQRVAEDALKAHGNVVPSLAGEVCQLAPTNEERLAALADRLVAEYRWRRGIGG